MKLLTVHARNIASLENVFIDFTAEPLASAPIFLISGQTGVGKSAILDAIALALYGTAPRLKDANSKHYSDSNYNKTWYGYDIRFLVRRGATEAFSCVTFIANNGRKYTAEVSFNFGKQKRTCTRPDKSIYTLTDANGTETFTNVSEYAARVTQILGMDFDTFTRTCLLAQGNFQAFLKASTQEKGRILEQIVGLQEFTAIGFRINEMCNEAKQRLGLLNATLKGTSILNDEVRAAEIARRDSLQASVSASQLSFWQRWSTWLTAKENGEKRVADAETAFRKAGTADNALAADRQIISIYNRVQPLREITTQMKVAKTNIAQAEDALRKLAAEKAALRNVLTDIDAEKQNIEKQIADISTQLSEFEQATAVEIDLKRRTELICNASCLALQGVQRAVMAKIAEFDSAKLANDESTIIRRSKALEAAKAKLADIAFKNTEISNLIAQIKKTDVEIANHDTAIATLNGKLAAATEAYTALEETHKAARLSCGDQAKALRHSLSAPCDCPVCGSRIEKLPLDEAFEAALKPLTDSLEARKADVKAFTSELNTRNKSMASVITTAQTLNRQLAATKAYVDTLNKELVDANLTAENIATEEKAIELAARHIEYRRSVLEDLNGTFRRITACMDVANVKKNTVTVEITTLLHNVEARKVTDNALLAEKQRQATAAVVLAEDIHAAIDELADCPDAPALRRISIKTAKSEARKIVTLYNRHTSTRNFNTEQLNALNIKYSSAVNTMKCPIPDDLTLGLTPEEAQQKQKAIEAAAAALAQARATLEAYRKVLAEHMAEKPDGTCPDVDTLTEKIAAEQARLNEVNAEIGAIKQRLDTDEANRRIHAGTAIQIEQARQEVDQLNVLNKLFGQEKFRHMIASRILTLLIASGNRYLAEFASHYRMGTEVNELANNLNVIITDIRTGQERPYHTLSGGETFMVSLALALGLASMGNSDNFSDVLFVDEGFGSLSPDCLNTVLDTLEKLQSMEKRRLGVISHVEIMRERIPVRIDVHRTSASTSAVSIHSRC